MDFNKRAYQVPVRHWCSSTFLQENLVAQFYLKFALLMDQNTSHQLSLGSKDLVGTEREIAAAKNAVKKIC